MHSVWVRLNAVVFFGLSVLALMAAACAMTSSLHTASPVVNTLRVTTVQGLRNHGQTDRAVLKFDIDADLSSVFHWNVKQLFVFLIAEYTSDTNALNQVVVWDHIARTPEEAIIKVKDAYNKYALIDQGSELRAADVTLKLSWDVMPVTGSLNLQQQGVYKFKLPSDYV